LPLEKIFVADDQKYGSLVSVTASHELLEALADPEINECVINADGSKLYAKEVSDAVEDDSFGYKITVTNPDTTTTDVVVSDFVKKAFWCNNYTPAEGTQNPYDFGGYVTAPYQILKAGYLSVVDMTNPGAGWQQVNSREAPPVRDHSSRDSRHSRRGRKKVRSTFEMAAGAQASNGGNTSAAAKKRKATGTTPKGKKPAAKPRGK